MVIAFWNINNNTDLADLLIDFVKENSIDVLLLAEAEKNPKNKKRKPKVDDLFLDFQIKSKQQKFMTDFWQIPNGDFRVKILSSLSPGVFKLKNKLIKSTRWTAFHIEIPSIIKFNLFPVHFHSKVNWSEFSQALECVNFSRDIIAVESDVNCENTILIGDFNMNPFENGLVSANGINAIQDLEYASKNPKGRKVDGNHYKFFYNPMWNHFGDLQTPSGTHYHRPPGHISHEWQMYDQILVRSHFKPYIDSKSFKIITNIAGTSLCDKNKRPDEQYSDHFPILIDLKI